MAGSDAATYMKFVRSFDFDSRKMFLTVTVSVGIGIYIGWYLKSRVFRLPKYLRGSHVTEEACVDPELGEYKLIIVVRNDLKMGKGKIAAQCSHAAVSAYRQLMKTNPDGLKHWLRFGQPKVVVKVETYEALLEVQEQAQSLGLTTNLIRDAGRTQLIPGSVTVLGIGPGPKSILDKATGHLKLL